MKFAVAVSRFIDLGIDDQLDVDAARRRSLEPVGYRSVAEFVEAAEQRIAGLGVVDEFEHRFVEFAAQPLQGFGPLFRRRLFVRREVVELSGIGLARGDAAIEEHVMLSPGEKPFSLYRDFDGFCRTVEVLGLPLERVEPVGVGAAGFAGEIVPNEALHRMVECRHRRVFGGRGQNGFENLEAVHEVTFILLRVFSFNCKAEKSLCIRSTKIDGKRNGIGTAYRKDTIAAYFL